MASLGYGDVRGRMSGIFLIDGLAGEWLGCILGIVLSSPQIPIISLLTNIGNWVLTPVRFSENSSRGTVSWLSETSKKTSSIRPKIKR